MQPKKSNQSIGRRIDEIVRLQTQLEKAQAKLMPLEEGIKLKREALFKQTKKADLNGARGTLGSAAVVKGATIPNLVDYAKFLKFASKKGNDDLIPRKVATAAWRERYDQGVTIPGVQPLETPPTLRITRF